MQATVDTSSAARKSHMQGISFDLTPQAEEALTSLLDQRIHSLILKFDSEDKLTLDGTSEEKGLEAFSNLFKGKGAQPCYGIHASILEPDTKIYCIFFSFI
jgi:hypothetical protein